MSFKVKHTSIRAVFSSTTVAFHIDLTNSFHVLESVHVLIVTAVGPDC